MHGYLESQLLSNRAAVLLHGGTEAERRGWATEASHHFEREGTLYEAKDDQALAPALKAAGGVVYVPDAQSLSSAMQRELVRVLRQKEERAKFVLGLPVLPDTAWNKGLLRDDLHYALHRAQVDLSKRRAKLSKMK